MGTSKTYRGGPGFQAANTPGQKADARQTYSKGSRSTAEGTMESSGGSLRGGAGGQKKSGKSKSSVKNTGPYGMS